jgi:tRNA G18 (ribose-2'-O)-methylase SpoU
VIIPVDDPDDPRVAAYRDIREKDLVGRQGRFIAEGEVVLRVLLTGSRHRPVSLLIAAGRAEKLAPLLALVPPGTPIYAASQAVLDAVAGFHLHRGILALAERAAEPSAADLLAGVGPGPAIVMGLSAIANHDNMGGLFRNAAAFGVAAVVLDAECCDPLYRKAIRVSVGGVLRIPFARLGPGGDLLDAVSAAGFEAVALSPSGAVALSRLEPPPRAALLLGAEGPGLAEDLLARARTVSIPMAAGFDSLNVATAAGIALHHLRAGAPG